MCKDKDESWLNWVREGVTRTVDGSWELGRRRLPLYSLLPASLLHRLLHYFLSNAAHNAIFKLVRRRVVCCLSNC